MPLCKNTQRKGHEPIKPLTEQGTCFLPFSFALWRVIMVPLTMRNPQLPQNLALCCIKVHSQTCLSTLPGTPLTDHCIKTWFSRKLLLAKPPLKQVCIIWLSMQLGRKCIGNRVLCSMTIRHHMRQMWHGFPVQRHLGRAEQHQLRLI